MTKFRVYYMAELERETMKEAEEDVLLEPNLLQYYRSEPVRELEEDEDPLNVYLDMREHFNLILDLNKIDEKDFKNIDTSTIQCIYENRTTRSAIFTGRDMDSKYEFVFIFPFKNEDIKIVKVLSTPNMSFTEHVAGKLIAEDLAKGEPDPWETSR